MQGKKSVNIKSDQLGRCIHYASNMVVLFFCEVIIIIDSVWKWWSRRFCKNSASCLSAFYLPHKFQFTMLQPFLVVTTCRAWLLKWVSFIDLLIVITDCTSAYLFHAHKQRNRCSNCLFMIANKIYMVISSYSYKGIRSVDSFHEGTYKYNAQCILLSPVPY